MHVVLEHVHLAQAEEHARYLHSGCLTPLIVLDGSEGGGRVREREGQRRDRVEKRG